MNSPLLLNKKDQAKEQFDGKWPGMKPIVIKILKQKGVTKAEMARSILVSSLILFIYNKNEQLINYHT